MVYRLESAGVTVHTVMDMLGMKFITQNAVIQNNENHWNIHAPCCLKLRPAVTESTIALKGDHSCIRMRYLSPQRHWITPAQTCESSWSQKARSCTARREEAGDPVGGVARVCHHDVIWAQNLVQFRHQRLRSKRAIATTTYRSTCFSHLRSSSFDFRFDRCSPLSTMTKVMRSQCLDERINGESRIAQ
ncbi:hypothetical protein [Pseudomonas sp. 44 R 15]|nr:hypothetical protein [Pseudomonas sp. 44 R 15]